MLLHTSEQLDPSVSIFEAVVQTVPSLCLILILYLSFIFTFSSPLQVYSAIECNT